MRRRSLERDLERALDRHPHRAEREATLLVDLGVLAVARQHRVDDDAVLAVVVEDEQPPQDPDLCRREPDPVGVVHQREHPLGELLQLLVERLDLVGPHPQHRVAVLADLRERDLAPGAPLGLLVAIVLVVLVLVVVTRRARGRARGRAS